MQKLINVVALLSGLTSLAVVGGGVYVYMNQAAWQEQAKEKLAEVIADGIAGESSGGLVKGDLEVEVRMNDDIVLDRALNFSLKSGSKTLANLSPYNGMMDILQRFGAKVDDREMYAATLGGSLAITARTRILTRMGRFPNFQQPTQ